MPLNKETKLNHPSYRKQNMQLALKSINCPVSWGGKIHRLHLLPRCKIPTNECPGDDTKQSDAEVPVMLRFWGMQSTPSLPSLPGPGVVAPDRALSMGRIEVNCVLMLNLIV